MQQHISHDEAAIAAGKNQTVDSTPLIVAASVTVLAILGGAIVVFARRRKPAQALSDQATVLSSPDSPAPLGGQAAVPTPESAAETVLEEGETHPSDLRGTMLLDEYEVVRRIGGGGMAQVYLAKSNKTQAYVAVKILNTEHALKPRSVERFRREARLICKLNNPHLVHGIVLGSYQDRPLIVMEYVNGPDIAQLIEKRGKLGPNESLKILLDVALGLNALFTEGSLGAHRDIKPQNIIVENGEAKLTDFGIAKALDDAEQMTLTASFLGSPHYMSPEQITDPRTADIRSDIYALGAVFYEMLTGRKAFPGTGTKEILDAHFELGAPRVRGGGALCEPCNWILAKTMGFNVADRYQTPQELIDDLVPVVNSGIGAQAAPFEVGEQTKIHPPATK